MNGQQDVSSSASDRTFRGQDETSSLRTGALNVGTVSGYHRPIRILLAIVGVLISYGSLYPFQWSSASAGALGRLFADRHLWTSSGDVLGNTALFVPWGFIGWHALRGPAVRRYAVVFSTGLALALALQILQIWVPARSAALADVFWNGVGTVIGLVLAPIVGGWREQGDWPPPRRTAGLLLLAWTASYLLPLVPSLDRALLVHALRPLLNGEMPDTSALLMMLASGWLAARLLVVAGFVEGRFAALLALLVLGGQPFLIGGTLTSAMLIGLPLGLLCGVLGGRRSESVLLALLVLAYLVDSLMPWHWLSTARPRAWWPFASLLEGDMLANSRHLAHRCAIYGGVIWLGLRAGLQRWPLVLACAGGVAATEFMQAWLPGRSSDPSEALWVVLAGWLLGLGTARAGADALPRPARPAVSQAAEPVRHGLWMPGRWLLAVSLSVLLLALGVQVVLGLPGMPYNARALFAEQGVFLAQCRFMLAWLTLGIGAALLARLIARSVWLVWLLLPALGAGLAALVLVQLASSVDWLMIDKIIGAPDLYRRVVAEGIWGSVWQARMQLWPADAIQTADRYVRFAALMMPWIVWPAGLLALLQRWRRHQPVLPWLVLSAPLFGAWLLLCAHVVYDWAITDNLVELIAVRSTFGLHGGWYLSALALLVSAAAVALAQQRRPSGLATLFACTAVLPGWWLLTHGLEQQVTKYGLVYSAQQFLLGPDRQTLLSDQVLMLRWFAVQGGWSLLLALGLFLGLRAPSLNRLPPSSLPQVPQTAGELKRPSVSKMPIRRLLPMSAVAGAVLLVLAGAVLLNRWQAGATNDQSAGADFGWRQQAPRIVLPELASWNGRGPAPGMTLRAEASSAATICQNDGLLNAVACWLLHGDDASEARMLDAMRHFVLLPARDVAFYGNAWELAVAYDQAARAPGMSAELGARVRSLLQQGLEQLLDVLDKDSASLWHGRATLSAYATLCAAALGPPTDSRERSLQQRMARHFSELRAAVALTEAWPEGYTYWIQERALPVTLALAAYQNGSTDVVGAAEAQRLLERIGQWHLHVVRPDFRAEALGDEGSRVDLRHHTREVLDLIEQQTHEPKFAVLADEISRQYGPAAEYSVNHWTAVLLRTPRSGSESTDWPWAMIGVEPTAALFGAGALNLGYWRSAWTADATYIAFRAGDRFTHHGRAGAGHFSLFKQVPLVVDSGHYGEFMGANRLDYAIRSIARNTIAVLRPGDRVDLPPASGQDNVADGGQRVVMATGSAITSVEDWRSRLDSGEHLRGGRLRRYGVQDGLYDYFDADLSDAYNTPAYDAGGSGGVVERVWRELLYLPGEDRLFVHDRVRSVRADYTKKWLLHLPERPQVDGLRLLRGSTDNGILESSAALAVERRTGATLSIRRLLPADAKLRLIGGPDYRWYVEADGDDATLNGINATAGAPAAQPWFDQADWRIEIQPGAARLDDEFLVVLSPSLDGVRDDVQALLAGSDNVSGALTPDSAVVFVERGAQHEALFTLPAGQRRLFLLGLPEFVTATLEIAGRSYPLDIDRNGVGVLDLPQGTAASVRLSW